MSNNINTELFERASYVIDNTEGTRLPEQIEALIKANNLEKLLEVVCEAERVLQEFDNQPEPLDLMTDERAEAMYQEARNAQILRRH